MFGTMKKALVIAAVAAAGAFAVPTAASAATASGCPAGATTDCVFTGGATQFRINTGGPGSGGGATVTCTTSNATAVTNNTDLVTVTLQFTGCSGAGFGAVVTCNPITITANTATLGTLNLSQNACTINVGSGLCTIRTSATAGGQAIPVHVTNATGAGNATLDVTVAGGTDALTFTSSGIGCGIAGVPASGNATFGPDPAGPTIVYEESPAVRTGRLVVT